jgi:hypothetical protein
VVECGIAVLQAAARNPKVTCSIHVRSFPLHSFGARQVFFLAPEDACIITEPRELLQISPQTTCLCRE